MESNTQARILTYMLHAHIPNIVESGCYEEELNKTLQLNNLPSHKTTFQQSTPIIILTMALKEETYEEQRKAELNSMEEITDIVTQRQNIRLKIITIKSTGWQVETLTLKRTDIRVWS